MGDTRRPSSLDGGRGGAQARLTGALGEAFDALPDQARALAVAASGGPDSSALAVLAAQCAESRGVELHVFHVHHGLHPNADLWAANAQALAARLGARFIQVQVAVDATDPRGVEAAARRARYDALATMAREAGLRHILLAHHQDDQVETILFRLLRGAGPDGVRAMSATSQRDGITYLRPWLGVPRSLILDFMQAYSIQTGFDTVDDPSNRDTRFARGALRVEVLPAIERHWPGYRATLERFARLAAESAALLNDVTTEDLSRVAANHASFGNALQLSLLRELPEPRQRAVLRRWLASHGLAMPSEARLQALCRQLQQTGNDGRMSLRHGAVHVRRYRDWVAIDPVREGDAAGPAAVELRWTGEPSMRVAALGGTLRFVETGQGIDAQWLRAAPLSVRRRSGGETLKLSGQTPSRTLKNLYQEHGIAVWERERLPLVYRQDVLVYAAGLGADVRAPQAQPGLQLQWIADIPGAGGD